MLRYKLGGGFKEVLFSPRKLGEDSQFDSYFSKGLKPPTSIISFDGFCVSVLF